MYMKNFIVPIVVALVATAVMFAYNTYKDYKTEKESDMLMQNIEVLTQADVNGPLYNDYVTCSGTAQWNVIGLETYCFSVHTHDQSTSDKDLIQDYVMSCCTASGSGDKVGSNNYYSASTGNSRVGNCDNTHASKESQEDEIRMFVYR